MVQPVQTSFIRSALKSGLILIADLDAAEAQLRAGMNPTPTQAPPSERQLADKLVEMGRLTSYQAAQLVAGVSKLTLGSYRILDGIGAGGMGQVFKAEHVVMGRIVAVKVLPRNRSTPDAIANFMREIRVQAQLDHKHLVRAFDAGHDGNVYFLVTEFVPGMDLRKYVRSRGPLSMNEAATIISQAAAGLQHAHEQGLVHRDMKPGNILVTNDGHAKVSDLGLAGWLNNESEGNPHPGKTVGTADYLPPEQIVAPGSVTPPGDIYSLGCTLYYAITGKVPYPGGTAREKIHRHCKDTPLHPRHLNPALSDEFIAVMAAMMEKDPAKRIQTASEVIRRLAPWSGEVVPAPRDVKGPGIDEPVAAPPLIGDDLASDDASELADTADSFAEFVDAAAPDTESVSQGSQWTDPVVAAELETVPNLFPQRILAVKRQIYSTPLTVWVLIVLAPVALVTVGIVIAQIIESLGH